MVARTLGSYDVRGPVDGSYLLFGSTTAQFAVAMLVVLVLLVAALRESDQPARTGPRHVARLDA